MMLLVLVHLIDHFMKLLLLFIFLDLRALKHHFPALYATEFGSAHGTLEFCLRPPVDAGKAEHVTASVNLGHVILAIADAAFEQ